MELRLQGVEVYTKLAQAYLAAGQRPEALKILKTVSEYAQVAGGPEPARGGGGTGGTAPMHLPGKLVISAPKALLDQVAAGKVSLDEFKKQASVQYWNFSPPETAPAKPPTGGTGSTGGVPKQ
jgi:hypothetical protein